jgi:mannose-1-phosphate guanylyltransferase / mannose-6-phosphate isomerase
MDAAVSIEAGQAHDASRIHPVVLSGGAGTRLWPLSRAAYPKQLLALASERSLVQETVARGAGDAALSAPIVVCNEEHRFAVEDQLRQIRVEPQKMIIEPVARNTGPAVAAAALWLVAREPQALMLVQPSDHIVGSQAAFRRAVECALPAARSGRLVTFGVKPTRAETGYGYILAGTRLADADVVMSVDRFIEKPDRDAACRMVDSGKFYWNSGIFLFSAQHFLDELGRRDAGMLEACRRAVDSGKEDLGFFRLDATAFGQAPSLSIDRSVMERTDRAAVVPVDMAWSDIGSWQALRDVIKPDGDGNVAHGDVILDGMRNSYVRSESGLVAAIGLDDVVIVATDDAVLVADAGRAAEVTRVVDELRRRNRSEPIRHRTCYRPWGYYRTTDAGDRFQVKRIMVKPGASLSRQKHFHRAEHWVVVQGTALVQRDQETMLVRENESIYIPIGAEHRLENPGKLPLHLVEVQSGAYLGEDDIVRLADNYGRA